MEVGVSFLMMAMTSVIARRSSHSQRERAVSSTLEHAVPAGVTQGLLREGIAGVGLTARAVHADLAHARSFALVYRSHLRA